MALKATRIWLSFSLDYQEALDAAGRAVADAWSMARHAAAPGLAVGVRGAVRVEQARPSPFIFA